MTGRRLGLTIGLAIAACLLVGRAVAGWLVDYRWYQSLDATPVFWAVASNEVLLRGAALLAGTALCFANLYAVRFSIVSVILPRRVGNLEIGEELQGRSLALVVLVVSVAMGALLALPTGDWVSLDLVRHGTEFRESDPYFGLDLAFWVYWLPLEEAFHAWATFALLLISGVSLFLYALTPSLRWQEGRLRISGHVRRHLFVLCSLCLLLLGWSYRLDALSLLLDGEGTGRAFLAIDHRIGIPGRLVLAMASVVCAMLVAWAGWVGQVRVVLAALAIFSVGAIGIRQVLPPLAARFLEPSEPDRRDRPYRTTRAAFSRRAFDVALLEIGDTLQGVTVPRSVPPLASWDVEAIRGSAATWGPPGQPLPTVGWMQRNGRPQAVVVHRSVGPNAVSRPEVALVDAAGRGTDGQLQRVEDGAALSRVLPPVAVGDSLQEGGVIADSSNAIAAPMLETLTARIVHAWGLQNPRLLRAQSTFGPTRLVRIRDVRTRVGRIFPFFLLGNRVLPLVVRDSLLWAVHLYASSAHYPLSEPIVLDGDDVSYLKHAGVAIVNAHTGRVYALRPSEADPVARSWYRRFPGLFVLASAASEELLRQVPPPVEGVLTQARVYARFGRRGDALVPPSQLARDTGADSGFAYPGLTPFVDAKRHRLAVAYPVVDPTDRLRGVVLGSGGADSRTAWLPLQGADRQWREVIETLRQQLDSVAAAQRGNPAPLLRGPVRVAVHEGTMVPFQVAYRWERDRAPLMEWIAIALGDRTRVGRTPGAALGFPEPDPTEGPLTPEEFRRRVAALYVTMDDALGRRDMLTFGEAWTALGRVLRGAPRAP